MTNQEIEKARQGVEVSLDHAKVPMSFDARKIVGAQGEKMEGSL